MFLNHGVVAMPVSPKKRGVPPLQSFSPLASPVPCDFHLLNLRTLENQEEVSPSLDTALLLHRKGFDCGLEAKNLGFNCTTNQGKLFLSGLFQNLDLLSIQPMTLSLMHDGPSLSNVSQIRMEPMEISSFRLRFR
uniref:Alpha-mannosidase 2x-like n=2 Tax=Erpetoichthys calabaricus TaxID=27687 RepID=A0A8C4XHQ1_ERPCA